MLQKEKLHPPLAAANILERERRLEAYYREIDCASRLGDRDQGVRLDAQSALQRIIDLFEPTAN